MITKDLGFVLKRFNFRDTSLLATIYTENFGKINGLFKAFYPYRREFTTSLDIFTLNEFIFYPRRSEIWLVSHADITCDYALLRNDFEKNITAATLIRVVDKASALHDKNKDVFNLLKDSLDNLKNESNRKIIYIFLIKFLTISGFKPEFGLCINCHVSFKDKVFFSTLKGGLLCQNCKSIKADAHLISLETSSTVEYIQRNNFPQVARINPSSKCEEEIILILQKFLAHHLNLDPFQLALSK